MPELASKSFFHKAGEISQNYEINLQGILTFSTHAWNLEVTVSCIVKPRGSHPSEVCKNEIIP